ncbi:hypothetical protein ABEG18_11805 [Alsobacter sp. KACC 23698]|uniref:Uncharacterized protein n=1 Tax=Alsobacter sp. KACC 23698 TaxID=3149229 RepID=A0AAU7JMQ7_9HYPH
MRFYSFSFGEMTVSEGDPQRPQTIATQVNLGFRESETTPVQTVTLRIRAPHDPSKTFQATEDEAFRMAGELLRAAAEYCEGRDWRQLAEETRANKSVVFTPSHTPSN